MNVIFSLFHGRSSTLFHALTTMCGFGVFFFFIWPLFYRCLLEHIKCKTNEDVLKPMKLNEIHLAISSILVSFEFLPYMSNYLNSAFSVPRQKLQRTSRVQGVSPYLYLLYCF